MSNEKILSEKIINLVEKTNSGEVAELVKRLKDLSKAKQGVKKQYVTEFLESYVNLNLSYLINYNSAFADALAYDLDVHIKNTEKKLIDLFNLQADTDSNTSNN